MGSTKPTKSQAEQEENKRFSSTQDGFKGPEPISIVTSILPLLSLPFISQQPPGRDACREQAAPLCSCWGLICFSPFSTLFSPSFPSLRFQSRPSSPPPQSACIISTSLPGSSTDAAAVSEQTQQPTSSISAHHFHRPSWEQYGCTLKASPVLPS